MTLPSITAPSSVWPFLSEGHSIDEDPYYAQIPYITGHSRSRRRWTETARVVTIRWLLEAEDLTEVTNWYEDVLLAGTREWSARVRKQGAGPETGLWWRARWIDYQTELLHLGRGIVSGRLMLTGEGSISPPDTGALATEIRVQLRDIRSSVAVQAHLLMEVLVELRQPLDLAAEVLAGLFQPPMFAMEVLAELLQPPLLAMEVDVALESL